MRGLWIGFTRGLALGLIGGLLAGIVEGASLVREAPVMRASLLEAAGYAILVDALACAGIAALAGALWGAIARFTRLNPITAATLSIGGTASLVVLLPGALWSFRLNGADLESGLPALAVIAIGALAITVGAIVFLVGRPLAAGLLARAGTVAVAGIVGAVCLGLVMPAQVVLEARDHASRPEGTAQRTSVLDPGLLSQDLSVDLAAKLNDELRRGGPSGGAQPNVLLITVDALRADHLGACGSDWMKTPSIDLLAAYSVVDCHMYPQQPQTNPALASIFTSTYPAVHGVRVHMVDRLSESFDTIAKALQRNGFTTAAIIPWTSLEPAFSGFHQGFHTYEAFVVNEPPTLQNPATAALAGIYRRVTDQVALGGAVEAVLGMRQGTEAEIDGRADVTAQAAMSWLAQNKDARFFLWVHYFDPHYPFTPPEPWDQLYDQGYDGPYDGGMGFVYQMREGVFFPNPRDVEFLRAMYASEVSYADHYIGQLLGYMARTGLLDNTIILLTADHGEGLGERGGPWPTGDYWLHGDDLYDPGARVPFMLYDPRMPRGHRELDVTLQHIDIMPTILNLVGLPIPRQVQGRSIVPVVTGQEDGSDRMAIMTVADDSQTAIVSADGWKLIVRRGSSDRELYYLASDPEEQQNLVDTYPDRALAMSRRLDVWAQANSSGIAIRPAEDGAGG